MSSHLTARAVRTLWLGRGEGTEEGMGYRLMGVGMNGAMN